MAAKRIIMYYPNKDPLEVLKRMEIWPAKNVIHGKSIAAAIFVITKSCSSCKMVYIGKNEIPKLTLKNPENKFFKPLLFCPVCECYCTASQ